MKIILFLLAVCLLTNCNNAPQKPLSDSKTKSTSVSPSDTLGLNSQINHFEASYKGIEKQLYDSVSRYKNDDIDFSSITGGLERKYKECNNEFEKVLLGYKLAVNYYIHFDSSKDDQYNVKAKPLFYSFVNYKNGEVASHYLKLELNKIHYIEKEWNNFSEQDKRDILFYGLLRGFGNGLPDVLKNEISKDSTVSEGKPTHQDLYSSEWKRNEIKAKLKFDPSTKKDTFNFKLENNKGDVQIELYHVNDRIITVEKRIFARGNDQLRLEVFDFTVDNACISMTRWKKEDRMSYIYSLYGDSLIKYDVNCYLMELNSPQRQKLIQSAKASLDSTMHHFPKFKYSFKWR